jgi:alpha-beta hydrolase superfamily lysophospholipase
LPQQQEEFDMHNTAFTFKGNKFSAQRADILCLLCRKPKTENRKPYKRVLAVAVMFLVSVVLTKGGTGVSSAAGRKEASKTTSVPSEEPKKVFDAHEAYVRYHFKDPDMDFTFGSLALGATVNHGCEIGEAFATAARIKDGDAASWQEEWAKTARLVEARGEQSLAGGHRVSARDQLQRASYYFRLALLAMLPADPRLKEYARKSRSLLKKAGELFAPPLEYFEIPFESRVLPGFFRKAAAGGKPAKTLIMIGGGETFAEDLFFYIGPQTHDRGYNFLTVDLPGQGLLPLEGKCFRPDMQVPLKAVVDYALGRPEVDPRRLAVYGYSGGGGFVPQAAMHDPRIKAIVMNACVVDARPLFATMPAVTATRKEIASWSSFHGNTVKLVCWRWGVPLDQPARLVEANEGFRFDPAKVQVPALIIVGEGEYQSEEVKRQQQLCLDNLPNPRKKLVVTPANEGAANHCVMENRSLMSQVVFDWLDEVFAAAQPKHP